MEIKPNIGGLMAAVASFCHISNGAEKADLILGLYGLG
jgi:hypothetical protein